MHNKFHFYYRLKYESDCKTGKNTSCSKKMLWLGITCHIYVYELISRPFATPDSDTRTGWTYFNTKLGCKKMQQVLRNARKFLNLMNTRTPVSGIILSPCMNNYNVKNTILSEKFFKVWELGIKWLSTSSLINFLTYALQLA